MALGENQMASAVRMFIAGIGTTLLLVGAGFGGGLMLATSAVDTAVHSRATPDPVVAARVILPSRAEVAEPTQIAVAPTP